MKNINKMTSKQEKSTVLFKAVKRIVSSKAKWSGTMSDLDLAVRNILKDIPQKWPGSPSALRVELNKVVYKLRNARIGVKFTRSAHSRLVTFTNNRLK